MALLFLGLYSVLILARPSAGTADALGLTMRLLYVIFIADYLVRLYLAENRGDGSSGTYSTWRSWRCLSSVPYG